ncbi:MAG TPA: UpxY family transcription antiterminator [Pedobacter sp.]|nr:UpxY family transcription antiterminator [Pedobacter sp.]
MNNTFSDKKTDKKWRIVYTRSNWEKKAEELLKRSGVTSYCPIVKSRRKWADRNKIIEIPLFSSYLFVSVDHTDQERVIQTSGVIGYVKDFGKMAELSNLEIERIKKLVDTYDDLECINLSAFKIGDKVSVDDGILFDLKGEILEVRGKQVVLLMAGISCGLIAKVKVGLNSQLITHQTN